MKHISTYANELRRQLFADSDEYHEIKRKNKRRHYEKDEVRDEHDD